MEGPGQDTGAKGAKGASGEFAVGASDRGPVRLLTLDRPEKLNAFTASGYRALTARLGAAADDDSVAVCVLTGAGRAFSAGVDLSSMGRTGGAAELGRAFDPLLLALAGFPKPLVAAVNGLAVGFGATILLHCDLVVVDEGAEIRLPFASLGTTAEAAASWLLPGRVGLQRAMWMVLSGQPFGADEAVAAGFALTKAVRGCSVEEALARSDTLAAHGVAALEANKRLLRTGWMEQVDRAWRREKAAMLALADEVGPIGWSTPSVG